MEPPQGEERRRKKKREKEKERGVDALFCTGADALFCTEVTTDWLARLLYESRHMLWYDWFMSHAICSDMTGLT
jgi:hypothetical protein